MPLGDYHLFAAQCSVRDVESGIEFNELENDLGDSYFAQLLYGSEIGNRSWALTLPTLPDGTMDSNTVTGINGETLTRAQYIWDLFCETKVTGQPFAYQDPFTNQYYLVMFADKKLTYQRMLTKLYSTGINLKQVRLDGETVFEPARISQVWGSYNPANYPETAWPFPFSADVLPNDVQEGNLSGVGHFQANGTDVVAATSGSLPIIRFSNTTNNGILTAVDTGFGTAVLAKDIFLLMKMREATFSNDGGIISSNVGAVALLGDSGTTKFFDLGFGAGYEYRLDGVAFAESNQQAPMNVWGAVHIRYPTGFALTIPQIGKDRADATRHSEMDLAYLIILDELMPKSQIRQVDEFLAILKSKLA
jgi:hypothetical protein